MRAPRPPAPAPGAPGFGSILPAPVPAAARSRGQRQSGGHREARSASALRSLALSCSLAPSLSCWLPVLGSQRGGGGDAQHRGERLRMLVSRVLKSTVRGG
ncbi:hypothetical protein H8959_021924 [Pygathrix nigripes]